MLELLDKGKAYDLYRIYLLEASVYGSCHALLECDPLHELQERSV